MKITYNYNPLRTTIKLDEVEQKELRYKIKINELKEIIGSAQVVLKESYQQWYNKNIQSKTLKEFTDEALNHLNVISEKGDECIDAYVDNILKYYLDELISSHSGDCTCMPYSCLKCEAEEILGIVTLDPDPGKHVLYKISEAFAYKDNYEWKQRSINEALEILRTYPISKQKPETWNSFSQADYERHIPRWAEEAKLAYEYLLSYRDTYFKDFKGE